MHDLERALLARAELLDDVDRPHAARVQRLDDAIVAGEEGALAERDDGTAIHLAPRYFFFTTKPATSTLAPRFPTNATSPCASGSESVPLSVVDPTVASTFAPWRTSFTGTGIAGEGSIGVETRTSAFVASVVTIAVRPFGVTRRMAARTPFRVGAERNAIPPAPPRTESSPSIVMSS